MSDRLTLDGLSFQVRHSPRRRRLGLTIDRDGSLILHAPTATGEPELAAWAHSKLLWVHRRLAQRATQPMPGPSPEYVPGETFHYLGKPYPLLLVDTQDQALVLESGRFRLRRADRPADAAFRRWYIDAGKTWLPQRIERLQARVGKAPTAVRVRDLGFRWASCGRSGGININWPVLQLSVPVIDYLLVHEMCHLIERGHGPMFWQAVERALPDWSQRRDALMASVASMYWCRADPRDESSGQFAAPRAGSVDP